MGKLKPCKFYVDGSSTPLTYDQMREMLFNNYQDMVSGVGRGIAPTVSTERKQEGPKEGIKKVLVGRAYKGLTEDQIKDEIERIGLTRNIQSHEQAIAAGQELIDSIGIDDSIDKILDGTITGAPAAYIFAKAIDSINTEVATEKDPTRVESLSRKGAELIDKFGQIATMAGQFNSMLAWVYENSDLGYSYEKKAEQYRNANNGVLPKEVEQKFKEYEARINELESKIKDAEEAERQAAGQQAIVDIKEDIERKNKTKTSSKEAAKKLADKIRKGKISKPSIFMSSSPGAIVWDTAIEIMANTIEAGGLISDAIEKSINFIRNSAWYKGLSTDKQVEADSAFEDFARGQVKIQKDVEVIDGRIRVPASVIRELVESGITDINDLVSEVQNRIPEGDGTFTDREVRDAITGYGKRVNPRKDQIERQVNELKSVGRLLSQIEDLKNGIRKEKNEEKKAKMSDKIKALRREANALSRGLVTDKEKLETAKERIQNQIDELNRRLSDKDFSKKKRPDPITEDTDLQRLRREKQKVKELFDVEINKAELKNRSKWEKMADAAIEIWSLPRALMATGEMSFILIQGLVQTISHPINAARALRKSIEHFSSERRAEEWGDFVKSQPYYDTMKTSKLSLSEFDAKLSAREEQFLGGWVNHIWDNVGFPLSFVSPKAYEIWKRINLFKALERAGVGYLNTIRILRFIDGMQMLEKQGKTPANNPKNYKDLADVINTFTGRSSLGKLESISKPLSAVFFSPRNWASIIKQTTPAGFFWLGRMTDSGMRPSVAQKVAIRDYMTYVATTASLVMLAASYLNDDDDEETGVELDPTSSDFMKIKIGDTRIDPWGGRIQMIIYQARMIFNSHKTTTAGEVRNLGETQFDPSRADLTWRLIKNKLSPSAGLSVKFLEAREKNGELVDSYGNLLSMEDELLNVYPMYWSTVSEIYKEDPDLVKHFLVAYGFFGGGVSTYGTIDDITERQKTKLLMQFKKEFGKEPDEAQMKKIEDTAKEKAKTKIEIDKVKRSINKKLNPQYEKIDKSIKAGASDADAVMENIVSQDWYKDLPPVGKDYVNDQLKRKYYFPGLE